MECCPPLRSSATERTQIALSATGALLITMVLWPFANGVALQPLFVTTGLMMTQNYYANRPGSNG